MTKDCRSDRNCGKCNKEHSTLLLFEKKSNEANSNRIWKDQGTLSYEDSSSLATQLIAVLRWCILPSVSQRRLQWFCQCIFHAEDEISTYAMLDQQSVNEIGHYNMTIPFKKEDICLPKKKSLVKRRLQSLRNKMSRNPRFQKEYVEFMVGVIKKGYAEPCESSSRTNLIHSQPWGMSSEKEASYSVRVCCQLSRSRLK